MKWPAKHTVEPAADQYAAEKIFSAGASNMNLWRKFLQQDSVQTPPPANPLREFTYYDKPPVEHVREDVQDTWRRLAVPAITVHLTDVDA